MAGHVSSVRGPQTKGFKTAGAKSGAVKTLAVGNVAKTSNYNLRGGGARGK